MGRCRQCGKEMESNHFSEYCSEGCRRTAELQVKQLEALKREEYLRRMKETGQKTLEKWENELEKEVKKRKDRMAKLDAAIRGDNPYAIIKAIKGGMCVRICRLVWRALFVIPYLIGIIAIIIGVLWFTNTILTDYEQENSQKAVAVVNELPSLEEKVEASTVLESQADTNATLSVEESAVPSDK